MQKKELTLLFLGYILVSTLLWVVVKLNSGRFSQMALANLTQKSGTSKQFVNDPCAFSIVGEPNAGARYVKLNITCAKGERSLNTFDVNAIKADTLEALLLEFQRINGVSAETKKYSCKQDSAPIVLTSKLTFPSTIECKYEN